MDQADWNWLKKDMTINHDSKDKTFWKTIEEDLEKMAKEDKVSIRYAEETEKEAIRLDAFKEVMRYSKNPDDTRWESHILIDWLVDEQVDSTFSEIAKKYRLGGKGNPFNNMEALSGEFGGEPALVLVFLIGCIICSVWTFCCLVGCLEKKCKWAG